MRRKNSIPIVLFLFAAVALSVPVVSGADTPASQEPIQPKTASVTESEPAFTLEIVASLNSAEWKIEGREVVTLHNRTSEPVKELVFKCRPNDFADNRSLEKAFRSGAAQAPSVRDPARLGYIDIREVRSEAEVPFTEHSVVLDGTMMRLSLPAPLEPGSAITLSITFIVKLPDRTLGGLGRVDRHVDALGWYPEPLPLSARGGTDPRERASGGQKSAGGDFDVTLTVPAHFKVEATGSLEESHVENAVKRVRYKASNVRDFCWTADPIYVREQNLYKDVGIVLMGQPFMEEKFERLMEAAKFCVDFNRDHLVPYPHKRFIVATTPHGAGPAAAGAMFASISQGHPAHLACLADRSLDPELALLRSWARQVFNGPPRASDDPDDRLEEGLASYLYLKMVDAAYGKGESGKALRRLESAVLLHLANEGFGLYEGETDHTAPGDTVCCGAFRDYYDLLNLTAVIGFRAGPFQHAGQGASLLGYRVENLDQPGLAEGVTARFKDAVHAGAGSMPRPDSGAAGIALSLRTLENHIGPDTMQNVLKKYMEHRAAKGSSLNAFLDFVSELAGVEKASLAATLLYENVHVDFAVVAADCAPVQVRDGFITQTSVGDRIHEEFESRSDCPFDWDGSVDGLISWGTGDTEVDSGADDSPAAESTWQWEVTVRNRGNAVLPLTLRLDFEGGGSELRTWDGKGGTWCLEGEGPHRLLAAVADPDELYALDCNRLNNWRNVTFDRGGVLYLAGWFHFWVQQYLNGWAFLN